MQKCEKNVKKLDIVYIYLINYLIRQKTKNNKYLYFISFSRDVHEMFILCSRLFHVMFTKFLLCSREHISF